MNRRRRRGTPPRLISPARGPSLIPDRGRSPGTTALPPFGPSPRITLQWEQRAGFCRFSITDNGAGVPASRLRTLFAPFDQLHETHSTGMGLSIVQRLTFLQGGNCEYEAPAQGGASFHFTVPSVASGVN